MHDSPELRRAALRELLASCLVAHAGDQASSTVRLFELAMDSLPSVASRPSRVCGLVDVAAWGFLEGCKERMLLSPEEWGDVTNAGYTVYEHTRSKPHTAPKISTSSSQRSHS